MRVVSENSVPIKEPTAPFATRRKLLLTAGFGLAGLIRTQDIFSMAQ